MGEKDLYIFLQDGFSGGRILLLENLYWNSESLSCKMHLAELKVDAVKTEINLDQQGDTYDKVCIETSLSSNSIYSINLTCGVTKFFLNICNIDIVFYIK